MTSRRRMDRFTGEAAALDDWGRAKAAGTLWYVVKDGRAVASLAHRELAERMAARRGAQVVSQREWEGA